jgi:hypothetical protein
MSGQSANGPIYIVSGLPRSGTSLAMQMLAAGGIPPLTDKLRAADEDNRRGYFEFEPVKATKTDPSWLAAARGKVVKMVYLLLYDLPADYEYRVVFLRRNLDEVLASQKIMLQRNGRPAGGDDATMKTLFTEELARVEGWLKSRANFQTLYVDYQQIVSEPVEQAKRMNDFLGGQWNEQAMAEAVDPTLYRNRARTHHAPS